MRYKGILLALLLPWFACEKSVITDNEVVSIETNNLIGSWIHPQYNDSTITFEKSDKLAEQEYGFSLEAENKFLERKNIGWCGTPPVSYGDYEGTWTMKDSILDITVPYWGGTEDYKWKIMSMDQRHLTLFTVAVQYHPVDE
jgi:hypothetical protein